MASEVGTAYVTLVPSAKGFASKMQSELGGDLARAGQAGGSQYGSKFTGGASKSIGGRAKSIFGGLAKGGALAAAAAGAVVGKVLADSIGAASDMGETLSKAGQIFGEKAVPGLEKFADAAAMNLGQSKQQALDAASTFAVFGKSAGLAGSDLVGFSTDFTTLASDMASFHNATPQEAIDAIGAALRGEVEPMRRFGVLLDDASMRAEALRLGLVKNTKEALTPQQKVLAAQALIFKQTGDAQGDFARTSDGLANQQRILSAQWENAKVQIGQGLLPVALRLVSWGNDLIPVVAKVASVVQGALGPAFARAKEFITGLFEGGGSDRFKAYGQAAAVGFAAVRDALGEVIAFVQAKVIPGLQRIADAYRDLAAKVLPIVRELVAVVVSKWGEIEPAVREIWGRVQAIITDAMVIVERVVRIATGIMTRLWALFGDNIKRYLGTALSAVVQIIRGAFQIVAGIFKTVKSLLTGDWRGAWDGIKQILRGAWNVIVGLVRQGWNVITFAFRNAGKVLGKLMGALWSLLKSLASRGIQGIVALVKSLPRLMLSALSSLSKVIGSLLSKVWANARQIVSRGISAVVDGVQALPGKLLALGSKFLTAGKTIIGKFVDGMRNAAGIVSGIAGNVWDAVRSLINGAIDRLNSALSFEISIPGPNVHVDVGNIPHLATGARATRGTLAVIGEGREPETVLPDSLLRGLLERTAAASAGGGLHGQRIALVLSDGTQLAAYVDERIAAHNDLAAEAARALGRSF